MHRQKTDLAYQSASAEGATQIGLLKLVYDRLARDFTTAAEAVRSRDVATRCTASNHALLLLGHLESWGEYTDDAQLAASLAEFYAMLRSRTLQIQHQGSPAEFEQLATLVLDTRAAWDRKEAHASEQLLLAAHSDPSTSADVRPSRESMSRWSA